MIGIYGNYEKECPKCKKIIKRQYQNNVFSYSYRDNGNHLEVVPEKCEHCATKVLFPIDKDSRVAILYNHKMQLHPILH